MRSETDLSPAQRGRNRSHLLTPELAALASRQHGVVGGSQLLDLGISQSTIDRWARTGRLHRIYRGVYAVGHRKLSRRGWWMAATLGGGRGAVLSHRPAGAAWNLCSWSGRAAITVPLWRRSTSQIEIHSAALPADERTVLDGIPITTVSRTILGLASVLDRHALARVVEEAELQRLRDSLSMPAILERHRGERGTAKLAAVLDAAGYGMGVTVRALEELFVAFVVEQGLPHPELNAALQIDGAFFRPDCLWRRSRLIVELHSVTYHGTPQATTRDAGRDRRLLMAGWTVIHVTWAQLHDAAERRALAIDLRSVLSRSSG